MADSSPPCPTGPLLVFDFDHTITELNTDMEVQRLAPGGKVPEELKVAHKEFTEFMGAVFELLHKHGTSRQQILEVMGGLELTAGMQQLLESAGSDMAATIIIISDSNSEFIRHILEERGLAGLVDRVLTNPAAWTEDGRLEVRPHHRQEDCSLSGRNLCKGRVLQEYLASCGRTFPFVCYVGDGRNDLCPALRLAERDLVCVREGFSLQTYIPRMAAEGHVIRAEQLLWTDARQIQARLEEKLA